MYQILTGFSFILGRAKLSTPWLGQVIHRGCIAPTSWELVEWNGMKKNLIVGGIVLALIIAGGSVFLWQKNQADVAELNNALPEGIRVVKSLFGNEYRVVNKIDGYEFRVPKGNDQLNRVVRVNYVDLTTDLDFGYTPYMEEEYKKSTISETSLLVEEYTLGGFNIRKFSLREDIPLELFVENLKSVLISAFQTDRIRIEFTEENLKISETDTIVKLHAIAKTPRTEIELDYFYIFKRQTDIYALVLTSDTVL